MMMTDVIDYELPIDVGIDDLFKNPMDYSNNKNKSIYGNPQGFMYGLNENTEENMNLQTQIIVDDIPYVMVESDNYDKSKVIEVEGKPYMKVEKPKDSLLELIANGEGTSFDKAVKHGYKSEYDVTLGYGAYADDKSKPVSTMTLNELIAHQTKMLRNKKNKLNSSAAGKYQITRTTLKDLMKTMKLDGNSIFSQELQDKMAMKLLERRGLQKFKTGKITKEEFQNNLSKEWASIARFKSNKGSYGQHVGTSSESIGKLLDGYLS